MHTASKFLSLQPLIPAADVGAAVTFYGDALGFKTAFRDGSQMAILYRGDVQVFITIDPEPSHARATSLRIGVENIESLYEEYSSKNVIHPEGKLTIKPWGLKEFTILDLNGVCIAFHETRKAKPATGSPLNPPLESKRLWLRRLEKAHFAALHSIYSDAPTMKHWHTPPHGSSTETEKLAADYLATESAWVLELKESGTVVGLVNCQSLAENKPIGMGYILAAPFQAQGLAREACEAVIQHVFTTLNAAYVDLWIFDDNLPSLRLAEKLGFKKHSSFQRTGPDGSSMKETGSYWLKQSEWWKSQ